MGTSAIEVPISIPMVVYWRVQYITTSSKISTPEKSIAHYTLSTTVPESIAPSKKNPRVRLTHEQCSKNQCVDC